MKLNNFVKTAILATGLTVATMGSAYAANTHCDTQPKPCGIYTDLLIGYGKYDLDVDHYKGSGSGFAGTLNVGYQFNQNVALEAGLGAYAPRLVGKFILPLNNAPAQLFVKAGVGTTYVTKTNLLTQEKSSEFKPVATAGVGGTYWLNNRWGLTAEANYSSNFGGNTDGVSVFSVLGGATYHF